VISFGVDYNNYKLSIKMCTAVILIFGIILFVIGYTFYRNIYFSISISFLSVFSVKYMKAYFVRKRKRMLNLQFRDMLYVLSSSLSAGRSIINSFENLCKDLSIEYKNPDDYIILEANYIRRRLSLNESLESILSDFAKRAGLEDINNFVNVFITCKKTGGDLVVAINETSKVINEKIKICNDINTNIASRKFEILILNLMPFILIITISFMSKDYFNPLYNTFMGRIVTTISLSLLLLSNYLSYKIINIEV
jgi:tight adherence protein B